MSEIARGILVDFVEWLANTQDVHLVEPGRWEEPDIHHDMYGLVDQFVKEKERGQY